MPPANLRAPALRECFSLPFGERKRGEESEDHRGGECDCKRESHDAPIELNLRCARQTGGGIAEPARAKRGDRESEHRARQRRAERFREQLAYHTAACR